MSDQQPLSTAERDKLARSLIDVQLGMTKAVDDPKAVLTAGQPGSGKSMIVRSISVQFEGVGGAITIDPDAIRPNIPYMRERIAKGDLSIPDAAYQDAGTIAAGMMKMGAEANRNIIYDGTLSNTFYAKQNADYLRTNSYRVEIHGMAVDPDLSHARTYSRREAEIASSPTSFGRGVGDQFHDDAVSGLVSTIKALQDAGKVDAIVLYDRTGQKVGSARLEEGRWVPDKSMADELMKVHALPDQGSRDEAAKTWGSAATLMEVRNADPDDRRKVEAFRDAARALATPVPGQQADSDKLATLRVTEQPAGPRSVLSPAKVQEELDKYLPTARLEAVAVLRSAAKAGATASEIEAARSDLNYLNHAKGPAYQARLVEQLDSRDVQAVITRNQTPLERVRELGAAIGAEIRQRDPGQVAKAMTAMEQTQFQSAPARSVVAPQKHADRQRPNQERERGR
jgi:predicted ABC-type ATPase